MILKLEDYYFDNGLKWTLGTVGLGTSAYLAIWTSLWWASIIIVLALLLTMSTKYYLSVDLSQKEIVDEFHLLWITTRSTVTKFDTLDVIFIEKERHTYTANSRGKTGTTDFNEYIGILKYDGDKHLELKRSTDYQGFIESIQEIANKIGVEITRAY